MANMDARTEMKLLICELLNEASEARAQEIAEKIDQLSPDPNWSDYLFHSEEFMGDAETLLMEKFLDRIFSCRPILL